MKQSSCGGDITSHQGLLDAFLVRFPVEYAPLEEPVAAGYRAACVFRRARRPCALGAWTLRPGERQRRGRARSRHGIWIYRNIQYRRREDRGVQTSLERFGSRPVRARIVADAPAGGGSSAEARSAFSP